MEEEKKKDNRKNKQRPSSEDPNESFVALKRLKKNFIDTISFQQMSISTIFYHRPFHANDFRFSIPKSNQIKFRESKYACSLIHQKAFLSEYERFIGVANQMMGKVPQEIKKKEKRKREIKQRSNVVFNRKIS